MKKAFILLFLALSCAAPTEKQLITQADKERAADLVSQMTLDEKLTLIAGEEGFFIPGIERLGIPRIETQDGPQGVRRHTKSTMYPSGLAWSATWNPDVARSVGKGVALDAKARGASIMLGPGANIYRSALCGRNFEYGGEDPFLAGEIVSAYIKGMQEEGVVATVKHFACNNNEYGRVNVNINADERTLNEIYFPAFRKAVQKGQVGAVMTSYNPLNGTHASENAWLIKENLRKWGFEGIVMSDWGSNYDAIGSMLSGIDLEMPDAFALKPHKVKPLLESGVVPMEELDQKCRHILQVYSAFGLLDRPLKDESIPLDFEDNNQRAYEAALEAPVLLRNAGGILPLKPGSRIVVLGPNADIVPLGGGSGAVTPPDGRGVSLRAGLEGLDGYEVTYLERPDAAVLSSARAVVLALGFHRTIEHEGEDRPFELPAGQDALVEEVLQYNSNVVAVVYGGGEFGAPWIERVPGVLMVWYPGQCGGRAVADLLSGKVSPSGRLPITFWGALDKNPAQKWYYPVESPYPGNEQYRDPFKYADYAEGVFLGYRGVEHFGVEPLYPFGYGLTYSSFEYSSLAVKKMRDGGFDVSFTLKNTGSVEAAEVAQVYVAQLEPSLPRPERELKGFAKIRLAPGETQRVTVHLDSESLSHWDIYTHSWVTDPGKYIIQIGSSSRDILLEKEIVKR
ncbi:MAG: glycoside hydrolase family 3 C-terminal domain-containing protein [Bacteroidales bacterium]|nr:glycoside hydrolase family 3 C-terminal domain-containing protein [Bacteroidales bacterium]